MDFKVAARSLMLVVALVGARVECLAGTEPVLPYHLENHLVKRSSALVVRCDWQAMRGLSPVRSLLEDSLEESLVDDFFVVGAAVLAVRVLGFDETLIDEIWVAMPDPIGSSWKAAWVATALDSEEIERRLIADGWVPIGGETTVFARAADVSWCEEEVDALPEADRDSAYARVLSAAHKVGIMEDGWLYLVPPFGSVPWRVRHPPRRDGSGEAEEPAVIFPFDGLLSLGSPQFCAIAIDIQDDGNGGEKGNDDHSLTSMRDRLGTLTGAPGDAIVNELGDFFITLSELDGGIALDVLARRADGGGEATMGVVLELVVLFSRLGATYASPALATELAGFVITEGEGEVRGSAVLSTASVVEMMDMEIRRRSEIHELTEAVHELERDEERQRATEPR